MTDATGFQGPLAHAPRATRAAGVMLGERPFRGHLNLRGSARDIGFLDGVRTVLGLDLPLIPNTSASGDGVTALWLGPDEWLLSLDSDQAEEAAAKLRDALATVHAAITDVSHARTVLGLAGPDAREVLAKGCGLDLHPRAFAVGACAQSTLAKATVILHLVDATPTFEIHIGRSFAQYLWVWLQDAAGEYGFTLA